LNPRMRPRAQPNPTKPLGCGLYMMSIREVSCNLL
jgi:hypothetical protein